MQAKKSLTDWTSHTMAALIQEVFIGCTKSRNEPWPTVCVPIVMKELPYLISCREKSIQAYHLA